MSYYNRSRNSGKRDGYRSSRNSGGYRDGGRDGRSGNRYVGRSEDGFGMVCLGRKTGSVTDVGSQGISAETAMSRKIVRETDRGESTVCF